MTKRTFKVTVDSPYGTKPIEQFVHFMRDIKSDADTRWGISIQIERVEQHDEQATKDDFQ